MTPGRKAEFQLTVSEGFSPSWVEDVVQFTATGVFTRWKTGKMTVAGTALDYLLLLINPSSSFFILLPYNLSQPLFLLSPLLQVLPFTFLIPRSTPLFPLQKRASLPGISTKHGITRFNKTRPKPLYQGWARETTQ